MYTCECGREFEKKQSFNAHCRHCKIHLGEERYNKNLEIQKEKQKLALKGNKIAKNKRDKDNEEKLAKWISEQHTCEYCGKIMTEFYGSGRFCCRSCSNAWVSNNRPEEAVQKCIEAGAGNLYRSGRYGFSLLSHEERSAIMKEVFNRPESKERFLKYCIPAAHTKEATSKQSASMRKAIENGARPGFLSTGPNNSYPEKAISIILDKLGINYIKDYSVSKSKLGIKSSGAYRLDFYIPNGNVDLEVDGSQHLFKDRMNHDLLRNNYLISNGYNVFRIKWFSGNKTNISLGSDIIEFKEWYKNIVDNNLRGLLRTHDYT